MNLISDFIFRLSPSYLVMFAGVLKKTVESSEDTKFVREFTEIFPHEEYDDDILNKDSSIIKTGLLVMYKILHFVVGNLYVIKCSRRYKYLD